MLKKKCAYMVLPMGIFIKDNSQCHLGRRLKSHPQFVGGKTVIDSLNDGHLVRHVVSWKLDS